MCFPESLSEGAGLGQGKDPQRNSQCWENTSGLGTGALGLGSWLEKDKRSLCLQPCPGVRQAGDVLMHLDCVPDPATCSQRFETKQQRLSKSAVIRICTVHAQFLGSSLPCVVSAPVLLGKVGSS